jgi:trimethylamine--corrinoid protein Co-methyltransferase
MPRGAKGGQVEEQQVEGDPAATGGARGRRRRRVPAAAADAGRSRAYRRLENPFPPLELLRPEQVEQIHASALALLRDQGVKVLLDEARELFRGGGAIVDDETELVRLGPELVEHALATAPARFELLGRSPERTVTVGGRSVVNVPVSSPPAVSDLDGGKRPGNLADFRDLVRLTQAFDVLQVAGPCVEPQDVPLPVRHYATCHAYLTLTDKVPYVYARGRGQVADGFEMFRIGYGIDRETFESAPRSYTVINTNSPRQLDIPMCMGIIDFARAGQLSIITPFTLAGAMAPVSLAGALTLQHAEALAGVVLAQLVRPGAPVVYGAFTSNVDMRSGAPAFGTPEYFKSALAGGQLARHVGLPYRTSAPNASNAVDAQAMTETMMSLFAAVLGGGNVIIHAAGWLEGGLTASKEKLILDVEALQMVAETFQPLVVDEAEIALDAIAATPPGGHFFGGAHTLERYRTAFYTPLVSDWSNFGQWTEAGSRDATTRANEVWKRVLADWEPPPLDDAIAAELDEFVARRTAEGGAPPES